MNIKGEKRMENVRQTPKAVYFSNASGLHFRLTHEGTNGWRLQSSKTSKFDNNGAAQMLSKFLEEKIKGSPKALSCVQKRSTLIVTEKNGTKAILSLGKKFSISFCDKNGNTVTEIRDVVIDGTNTVMKGVLAEGEAIYGGGERLDVANKRGTAFDLYTCDGWNNSSTTYVVIPVFLTTRGGGMYFNRNESAKVDFGMAKENEWSYLLRKGDMDCYFYPTGDMKDTLRGYMDLAGHPYMPTPWMQGMHICRYGPDFWRFEADKFLDAIEMFPDWEKLYVAKDNKFVDFRTPAEYVSYTSLSDEQKKIIDRFYLLNEETGQYDLTYVKNDAGLYFPKGRKGNPGGSSCKTIMQNFINEDMKPDAASMENRGWAFCYYDTDESRANREDLRRSVEWLHSHGLKAMVYMRVGGAYPEMMGCKDEYHVHADMDIPMLDGSIVKKNNTTKIIWLSGTGENPDIGRRPSGGIRTNDFIDITNEEAIEWYFDGIWEDMIEMGVDGVKIDYCECMPDGDTPFANGANVHYRWKHPEKFVPGTEHHAYPPYFISLFYKKMVEKREARGIKDGFMVFTRGGGIGSQRNPYMWSGDQARWFEKLDDQILAVVNSGLSGLPFMSYDMAGYSYGGTNYFTLGKERESEIFARAVEFTAFMTQMQTHGDVRHAYEMTEEVKQIYRNFTRLHTDLIPYMQKYSRIACDTGVPPVRHLVLNYPSDVSVHNMIDEFMLGEGLLIAPILAGNTFEREVYLPKGSWTNLLNDEVIEGGKTVRVAANLGQIPVFLNNDSKDAAELREVFMNQNWKEIKKHK